MDTDLLVIFAGLNLDVVSIYVIHVFRGRQLVDGFILVPRVPYLESHLLFVVIIHAFRALQLKRGSSPLECWRFVSMERVRCSFRPRVRASAKNHVFLGGTRRRWIVLDSRDT